ncbi:MAG: vitamin K epoxide reductase family protein [Bacteroidota bacterium]
MAVPLRTRTLARVLFAVALFGILAVTHLALQVQSGFANGCTGLETVDLAVVDAAPTASDCAAVATGEYKDFLGISNILWGLGFYILVALARLGYGITGDDRLRKAAFGLVGVGFVYTLRLVYLQAFVIGSFCILCMISAATVTTLLLLHVLEQRKLSTGARHSAPPPTRSASLRPYAAVAGVFAILLAADIALAGGEAPEANATPPVASGEGTDTRVDAPASIAPPLPGGCAYDPQFPPVADLSAFVDNPSEGTGPVVVVEIFDPNCPHCRDLHEALRPVKEANQNTATFYAVPFPLRQQSVGQAAALSWAMLQSEQAFFNLQEEMFRRQNSTWGMTLDEIREAANAVDLDGPSLVATLQNEEQAEPVLARVRSNSEAVQAALARPGNPGISVPKIIIGGRVVAPTNESYSERCLNQFIADANAPADAPEAVVE